MVRKVKFLCSHSTYREVLHLLDSASLKSFPLVDSKGNTLLVYLFYYQHDVMFLNCMPYT